MNIKLNIMGLEKLEKLLKENERLTEEMYSNIERISACRLEILADLNPNRQKASSSNEVELEARMD